jgi:hypothetical protein
VNVKPGGVVPVDGGPDGVDPGGVAPEAVVSVADDVVDEIIARM